jgi:MinD-like ATPase involved in chromosome partitioning or flagellar assembly
MRAVLVEADLDGGVLAVRFGLGREPGLSTFAAGGDEADGWHDHAQDAGGVAVLVGPDSPGASASLWRSAGERITRRLLESDGVAIVDAGRLRSPETIVRASELVAIVVNPVAEHLVALTHVLPSLRQAVQGHLGVVSIGNGPYRRSDIEEALAVPVLAELPDDRDAAELLRSGGATRARLARSRLARAVGSLAAELGEPAVEPSQVAS